MHGLRHVFNANRSIINNVFSEGFMSVGEITPPDVQGNATGEAPPQPLT